MQRESGRDPGTEGLRRLFIAVPVEEGLQLVVSVLLHLLLLLVPQRALTAPESIIILLRCYYGFTASRRQCTSWTYCTYSTSSYPLRTLTAPRSINIYYVTTALLRVVLLLTPPTRPIYYVTTALLRVVLLLTPPTRPIYYVVTTALLRVVVSVLLTPPRPIYYVVTTIRRQSPTKPKLYIYVYIYIYIYLFNAFIHLLL